MTEASRVLAAQLRDLQVESGHTLRELESVTHSSDSSLSRYFAGRMLPPWAVVEALCRAAERDPGLLRPLWLQARRDRVRARQNRASAAGRPDETSADVVAGGDGRAG
jgi:transcriptional regulator with XRE-family HTH domain